MGPGCFHPRNDPVSGHLTLRVLLQWGRDVSIPEMCRVVRGFRDDLPLQWGRDVSIPEM